MPTPEETAAQEKAAAEKAEAEKVAAEAAKVQPNPLEKQVAELQSKLEGLTAWENNRNQETVALKKELETMRLERQQQLANQPVQQNQVDKLVEQYNKAVEDGDTMTALRAKSAYDAEISAQTLRFQITNNVNSWVDAIAENPNIQPEVRQELMSEIYVDGNPRNAIRPEKLAQLAQPGALSNELARAKKMALGAKVLTGKYDPEVISRYESDKKAKEEAVKAQTPIAGSPGGGSAPTEPPAKTLDQEVHENIEKAIYEMTGRQKPQF